MADRTSNTEQLAELLKSLTYTEMMVIAKMISMNARSSVSDYESSQEAAEYLSPDYFAEMLLYWANTDG